MKVLLRVDGHWLLTEDSTTRVLDLVALEALVDPAHTGDITTDGLLPYDEVVVTASPLTGELTRGGWLIEGATGQATVLDLEDLTVLDAITSPVTPGQLAEQAGLDPESVARRLARLARLGLVHPEPVMLDDPGSATVRPDPRISAPTGGPTPEGPLGRVPVYAIWHPQPGPLLSLGMLTAAARQHRDGALNTVYEIRRPETADSFLADLRSRSGPAVLLCSDYVWSVSENLATARSALALNPDLVVIHGGPSSPKYEGDAEIFLHEHGDVAHVLTRGEGEHMVVELLDALADSLPHLDGEALRAIDGLTFRDPHTGAVVRTPDRERVADLDALPSPYLTGEFDHIPAEAWRTCLSIETNRGCPYGCTFCDWGSSTLSRIRKFDLERVTQELRWAAERGAYSLNIADANFGIMSRDVDTARRIAEIREATGYPRVISFYPAKNTTKHLSRITDAFVEAGVGTTASISLQTSDPGVLEAIDRSNIATDHYVALAADYRRRGLPLQGDLLLGLPGQTYETYRADLQFNLDHEIMTRTWRTHVLPNAPMNEPGYRKRHRIEVEGAEVVAAATFTREDRARMLRLRSIEIIAERYGVLRHVMRCLQWDHGILATALMDDLLRLLDDAPERFPHLTWTLRWFDRYATAPVGWSAFYAELARYLAEDHGVGTDSAFETVLGLQRFLMPAPGRTFPATMSLAHDYLAYYRDATASLYTDGRASGPTRPLASYPASTFAVAGDPLGLCRQGILFARFGTGDMDGDFEIGANSANELLSPLTRLLPHVTATGVTPGSLGPDAPIARAPDTVPPPQANGTVVLRRRPAEASAG